jgi:hypothetical protein
MSKALLAQKKQFKYNFDQEFPRRSKCLAKDRVVETLCVYLGNTKEKSTKNLERKPSRDAIRAQEARTFDTRTNFC